ncbi:ATP-binding protein [Dorea longicatena]|nr:ATP-binding protein [Dorea longicatena]
MHQPVEDKKVSVSRVNGIPTYPPNFIFITVTNPCSYGYYPKSCCISFDDQIIMNIKEVKNKL